jgi:iron complex outermembrane receptor protein
MDHRNSRARSAAALAGVVGGILGTPVFADAASGPTSVDALQTVEVIGRRMREAFTETTFATTLVETRILDIPQSVSAVTKETILDQGLMQLNDVAPFVAGVNEFSVYDDLTIRGFRTSDDRRVNGLRTYNSFWSQPYIAHLERVEIIKGPAAITFGDATPGGVVNLVTKKPLTEPRREAFLNLGSFDHRYLAFDATGPIGDATRLPYRLNASAWDTDSFRDGTFDDGWSLAPSLSWLPRAGTRLNLDVVHVDRNSVLDRGQPNVQGADTLGLVPTETTVTQPGDRLDTRSLSIALSGEQQIGERWTLAGQFMHYAYDEELVEHRIQTYVAPSVLRLGYTDRETEATVDSGTLYLAGRFATCAVAHTLVLGADALRRDSLSDEQFASNVGTFDVLAPEYRERDATAYALTPRTYGGELESQAGFAQYQATLGAFDVLAGVRYTRFTDRTIGADDETHDAVVPRFGVVRRLDADRSLYATWMRGFEAQFGYTALEGGPFGPTSSELVEVGWKQLAFDGRLLFTAAVYELTNRDIAIYANDPENPDLYRQIGEERARGVELEAVGRVTDRLRMLANYAWNEAEITEDSDATLVGRAKENAPEHTATLWARYDLPWGFGFGAGATHVAQRATFETGLALPSYTLVDAAVYYRVGRLALSVQGKNLTDETHWTGGYNFGRVFPGDPRRLLVTAAYEF